MCRVWGCSERWIFQGVSGCKMQAGFRAWSFMLEGVFEVKGFRVWGFGPGLLQQQRDCIWPRVLVGTSEHSRSCNLSF